LLIVAGTNSVDPLDVAVQGLLAAGGELIRQGMPAHPGSTYWLGRLGQAPVLGLSSCGMFSDATVFDILLPRLFTGLPVDADFLASLGYGGLLTSDMRFRFPPYGRRRPTA
jgi:molybdopterin biosynthesis enzyme